MAPSMKAGSDESVNTTVDSVTDVHWRKMFPTCVREHDDAKRFLVRAMYVAFSLYLRQRQILEEKCFKKNYICDKICARTLDTGNKEAAEVSAKIRAAGLAIDKGYLDEIALVLSDDDYEEEALEVLSFKIHYDKNGIPSAELSTGSSPSKLHEVARMEYLGTESVRQSLVSLVQRIQLVCQKVLSPLAEDYSANFRVSYTPETPTSFRIEGFADHSSFYKPHADARTLTLGHLRPNHFGSLLECTSIYVDDFDRAEELLKKHGDKLARQWGYGTNDTLQTTFQSGTVVTSNQSSSVVSSILSNTVTESPVQNIQNVASPEDVVTNLAAGLAINSPKTKNTEKEKSPKKRTRGAAQKPSNKRPTPYGRIRSIRRGSNPDSVASSDAS